MKHRLLTGLLLLTTLAATGCEAGGGGPADADTLISSPLPADTLVVDGSPPTVGAGECRITSDCDGGDEGLAYCRAPGEAAACGVSCVYLQMRMCESAEDCGSGQLCEEFLGPCCAGSRRFGYPHDGRSSRCVDRCATETCAEHERCDADGLCRPIPCTEVDRCGAQTACALSGGCRRLDCQADADCDPGGLCVKGRCYGTPGICEATVG